MPFIPIRPPRARSLDLAAQRIYGILEREERAKKYAHERQRRPMQPAAMRVPIRPREGAVPPATEADTSSLRNIPHGPQGGLIGALLAASADGEASSSSQLAQQQPIQPQSIPYKPVPLQMRHRSLPMPDPQHSEVTPDDWYAFHRAARHSGMAAETEIEAARKTFGHEGGMTVDPIAGGRNNPGIAGMTLRYMTDARDRGIARGLETDPYKLNVDDIGRWYDVYMDDALDKVGGGAALTQVRDHKLAMQLFDTLFQHGKYGGALVIQDAVNKTISRIPDHKRREHHLTPIVVEDRAVPRVVGPKTLERIKRLIASGYAADLRDAIADRSNLKQPTEWRHDYYR